MDYIAEIFQRLSLQQICAFLMLGSDIKPSTGTYIERLKAAEAEIDSQMQRLLPREVVIEAMDSIYAFAVQYQFIYMEIGLQCGVELARELQQAGQSPSVMANMA